MTSAPEQKKTDNDRASDHLANERTYLAWVRTGVATMGLGFVIAKLKYMLAPNYPGGSGAIHAASIGLLFSVIGVATIVMAVLFFLQTQKEIRDRTYTSRKSFVLILAALMGGLGLVIICYLLQDK